MFIPKTFFTFLSALYVVTRRHILSHVCQIVFFFSFFFLFCLFSFLFDYALEIQQKHTKQNKIECKHTIGCFLINICLDGTIVSNVESIITIWFAINFTIYDLSATIELLPNIYMNCYFKETINYNQF